MIGGRSTNVDAIARKSDQPEDRVRFALDELNKRRLIGSTGENYILYTSALDLLALKHYADQDYAMALGKLIAKGKESDVYEVLSAESELYALKLFRLGRTSFRDVRRKRASATSRQPMWLMSNYSAARHEFGALRKLRTLTENVPGANRPGQAHGPPAGAPRSQARGEARARGSPVRARDDPPDRARRLREGWNDQRRPERVQHTHRRARAWLIDWPQWVGPEHPNAEELLRGTPRAC